MSLRTPQRVSLRTPQQRVHEHPNSEAPEQRSARTASSRAPEKRSARKVSSRTPENEAFFLNCPMIKNLIFDYGGVLMDLDFKRTMKAISGELKVDFRDKVYREWFFELFIAYEKNGVSDHEFLDKLRDNSREKPSNESLSHAWNAMMLSIKKERFDMLLELRQEYKVYLLSNTNGIHYENMMKMVEVLFGNPSLDAYFDKQYYSHLMNMRKPDKEIFDFICNDNKLDKEETLFIDDLPFNVEGAIQAGLHSVQHEQKAEITEYIRSYITSVNSKLQ